MGAMRALLFEWLVAEGLIFYRAVKREKHVPMPGQLLAASGVYMLLVVLAEAGPNAATLAATLGAGFGIAAYFVLFQEVGGNAANKTFFGAAQSTAQASAKQAAK